MSLRDIPAENGVRTRSAGARTRFAVPPTLSAVVFYLGFALTGVCTVLPGAILPSLLAHWQITDRGGGGFFLALFIGSTLGSFLSRGYPVRRVAFGSASGMITSAILLFSHGLLLYLLWFVYGFGQGMLITCVSRARLAVPRQRHVQEINRLNLIWGLGAFCCPAVANSLLRMCGLKFVFIALAGAFGLLLVWMLAVELRRASSRTDQKSSHSATSHMPWIVLASVFFALGVESSMGAWIATYSHRLQSGSAQPVEAATLFWLGLLASRALCSTQGVRALSTRSLFYLSSCVALTGCVALIAWPSSTPVLIATLLVGLGIGPIYPTLIAIMLPRTKANSIFITGGIGSAFFPWLTGSISRHAGSLHVGIRVPVCAAVLLLALMPFLLRKMGPMRAELAS